MKFFNELRDCICKDPYVAVHVHGIRQQVAAGLGSASRAAEDGTAENGIPLVSRKLSA